MSELDRLRRHLSELEKNEQWHRGALTRVQDEIRTVKIKIMQIEEGQQGVLPGLDNDED